MYKILQCHKIELIQVFLLNPKARQVENKTINFLSPYKVAIMTMLDKLPIHVIKTINFGHMCEVKFSIWLPKLMQTALYAGAILLVSPLRCK